MFRGEESREDKAIDQLLRSQAATSGKGWSRRSGAGLKPCPGFDADLATAYIERLLCAAESRRYEEHLCECGPCRSTVARLALDDSRTIYESPALSDGVGSSGGPGWFANLGSFFLRPQWIVATAAVLIFLISIPILFTRYRSHSRESNSNLAKLDSPDKNVVPEKPQVAGRADANSGAESPKESRQPSPAGALAEAGRESASGPKDSESKPQQTSSDAPTVAGNVEAVVTKNEVSPPVSAPSTVAGGAAATGSSPGAPAAGTLAKEKAEQPGQSNQREARDQRSQSHSSEQEQSQALTGGRAQGSQLISSNEAMQVPQDQASQQSGQVVVLKKGVPGGDTKQLNDKVATVKPQDSVAPESKSGSADDGATDTRRVIARAHSGAAKAEPQRVGGEALVPPQVGSRKNDRSRIEKKVEGKRFRLLDGVWTDKQYNPYKEMPLVTVLRGSEVFNSLLAKEPELKSYFDGFGQDERVIVVYKKVAYRLVPQPASK